MLTLFDCNHIDTGRPRRQQRHREFVSAYNMPMEIAHGAMSGTAHATKKFPKGGKSQKPKQAYAPVRVHFGVGQLNCSADGRMATGAGSVMAYVRVWLLWYMKMGSVGFQRNPIINKLSLLAIGSAFHYYKTSMAESREHRAAYTSLATPPRFEGCNQGLKMLASAFAEGKWRYSAVVLAWSVLLTQ